MNKNFVLGVKVLEILRTCYSKCTCFLVSVKKDKFGRSHIVRVWFPRLEWLPGT